MTTVKYLITTDQGLPEPMQLGIRSFSKLANMKQKKTNVSIGENVMGDHLCQNIIHDFSCE